MAAGWVVVATVAIGVFPSDWFSCTIFVAFASAGKIRNLLVSRPGAAEQSHRWAGCLPGVMPPIPPPRLGRPTFDGRGRDWGARERGLGISERRACKPTARHHRIAVLRVSALLTSHRMAGGWTRTDRHDPPVPAQGREVRRPRARNRPRLRRHRWSPGRPSRHQSSPAGAPPPWSAPPG